MNAVIKKDFIFLSKEYMKKEGFLKDKNNWRKELNDIILLFNIQGSSYDKNDFYVNLGIFFKDLKDKKKPAVSDCHIIQRAEIKGSDEKYLVAYSIIWLKRYDTVKKIYFSYINGELTANMTVDAKKYLTTRANIADNNF
jgi:hypothetical protein